MKRWLAISIAALGVFLGIWLMTQERDVVYVLMCMSPCLGVFLATSLWMVWRWATAPYWDGSSVGDKRGDTGSSIAARSSLTESIQAEPESHLEKDS